MKRFVFPLERVRQYRKMQLEIEHARLEQCGARLAAVQIMESELQRQRLNSDQDLRDDAAPGRAVPTADLTTLPAWRGYLSRMEHVLTERKAESSREFLRQRESVLDARRRYEALDRRRGKAQETWRNGLDREEEAFANELFLGRWKRRAKVSA